MVPPERLVRMERRRAFYSSLYYESQAKKWCKLGIMALCHTGKWCVVLGIRARFVDNGVY